MYKYISWVTGLNLIWFVIAEEDMSYEMVSKKNFPLIEKVKISIERKVNYKKWSEDFWQSSHFFFQKNNDLLECLFTSSSEHLFLDDMAQN